MPTLQILSGEQEGSDVAWSGDEIFVGKEDNCAIKLSDAGVSRKHARVAKKGDGWIIEDLGSSNGTWVNFKKRASNEATDIADRDIIFIGRTVTKFWLTAPPAGAAGGNASSAGASRSGDSVIAKGELRDLLRGVVPVQGLSCPSCHADLESEMRARIRENEQVELIRRTRLHEVDQATLDRLLSQARR